MTGFYCGEAFWSPAAHRAGRVASTPGAQLGDFWSGEILDGGRFLPEQTWPLHSIPVYARLGPSSRLSAPVRGTV